MQRRDFLRTSAAGLAYLAASRSGWALPPATTAPPNILIVLTDDQGYADLGCFGSPYLGTPNLDALAKQGVRFTDFYAAAPLCSPSRTGLMTGRIPSRCGMYSYIDDGDPTMHLPKQEVTIAQLLKAQGYDTCHVGKWHLSHLRDERWKGSNPLPQPRDFGFDHSFGVTNNALPTHLNPVNFVRNGKSVGPLEGYSCQLVADEGIQWLKERAKADRPFFMYLCFNEPHETVAAPPDRVAHYAQVNVKNSEKARTYLACIENMDDAVGRVLKHLDASGLAENTLVLFHSDNGSRDSMSKVLGTNLPLRAQKASCYDGGIRVPGIMRWPGRIAPGSVCTEPVGAIDMLPTLCAVTGATKPADRPLDGTNLVPLLTGDGTVVRQKPLFWHFYNSRQVAMRDGDWSLVGFLEAPPNRLAHGLDAPAMAYLKTAKIERFELYNVREDIGQKKDLAAQEPERLRRMSEQLTALYKEVLDEGPVWTWKERSSAST